MGNAVKRAEAKRKLRSLCLAYESKITSGKYIFVAKDRLFEKNFKELQKDFLYAMKKMQLLTNENNI